MGLTNNFLNNKKRKEKMNGKIFDKILLGFLILLVILLTIIEVNTYSTIISLTCIGSIIAITGFIMFHWTGK